MAASDPERTLWTVDDVAAYLGMTTDWIYREVRAGRLPHVKLGPRRVRFRRESIDEWLSSRERGTMSGHKRPRDV